MKVTRHPVSLYISACSPLPRYRW